MADFWRAGVRGGGANVWTQQISTTWQPVGTAAAAAAAAAALHNRERIYDDSGAGCSTANSATVTSDRNTGTQQRRSADLLARDVLDIPKYRGIYDTIDGTSYYVV